MEFVYRVEEKRSRSMRGICIFERLEPAEEPGILYKQARGRMIGMPVLPQRTDDNFGPVAADRARHQVSVLRGIEKAAVREVQSLSRDCAEQHRCGNSFGFSLFGCASRTHFAVGHIDNGARDSMV